VHNVLLDLDLPSLSIIYYGQVISHKKESSIASIHQYAANFCLLLLLSYFFAIPEGSATRK
jgi:hypothetical protein